MTKEKLMKMLPYLAIITAVFYLLPLVAMKDTGSAMFILLIIMPAVIFLCSMIYGVKNPINLLYPLFVAVLFLPTVFIYYNNSALPYAVAYCAVALVGSLFGRLFHKHVN